MIPRAKDKFFTLVKKLKQLTEQDKIRWGKSADSDGYLFSFPNYSVLLHIDAGIIYLDIYDETGLLIDQTSRNELALEDLRLADDLTALYDTAKYQSLGVDKALDSILSNLDEF